MSTKIRAFELQSKCVSICHGGRDRLEGICGTWETRWRMSRRGREDSEPGRTGRIGHGTDGTKADKLPVLLCFLRLLLQISQNINTTVTLSLSTSTLTHIVTPLNDDNSLQLPLATHLGTSLTSSPSWTSSRPSWPLSESPRSPVDRPTSLERCEAVFLSVSLGGSGRLRG